MTCFAGVRLYQGLLNRTIPNYARVPSRGFYDRDRGSELPNDDTGRHDGLNDGLWCQSAMNVSGIGIWILPNGSDIPNDPSAQRIHMTERPGQVGLLQVAWTSLSRQPTLEGMYTCIIPDENGVMQTLVSWVTSDAGYDGRNGYCELKNLLNYDLYTIHAESSEANGFSWVA